MYILSKTVCEIHDYLNSFSIIIWTSAYYIFEYVAINRLRPDFVMLEICENRIESLCIVEPDDQNVTLAAVCKEFWEDKSFKTLGIGLLMWMQTKVSELTQCFSRLSAEHFLLFLCYA